jgi:hypothetical protein
MAYSEKSNRKAIDGPRRPKRRGSRHWTATASPHTTQICDISFDRPPCVGGPYRPVAGEFPICALHTGVLHRRRFPAAKNALLRSVGCGHRHPAVPSEYSGPRRARIPRRPARYGLPDRPAVNGRDAVVVAGGGFTGIEAATEIHSKTKARDAADDMGKRAAAQRTRLLA